jgi:glycosyltransferase involved in cell wall biosynthesis
VRIAYVVHDYNRIFGHSRYVTELAERFRGKHDVHVFANTFGDDTRGIVKHHVPALRQTALTTILSFYAMAATRVGANFDVVHAQGLVVPRADVITAHISNARWLEGRRHLEGGNVSWKEKLFGATVIPLERHAYQSQHATVVAVSDLLARDIKTTYGRTGQTVVIRHGVDFQQFNPGVRDRLRPAMRTELGLADGDVLHLFVGDLRKGFAQAIAAMPQVSGRLLGVSRTDPTQMLTRANELGVGNRVRVAPLTDRIERYYAAADVFVFPTPYDAFGMVITEAMACGLPVVTAATAGAAEIIEHGRTGLVIQDPTDVVALTTHLQSLEADAAERRRIGDAAAEMMRTHSWDSVASETMALYERLVSARHAHAQSPSS